MSGMHNLDVVHGDEHLLPELTTDEVNAKLDDFFSGLITGAEETLMLKASDDPTVKHSLFSIASVLDTGNKNAALLIMARRLRLRLITLTKEMIEDGDL